MRYKTLRIRQKITISTDTINLPDIKSEIAAVKMKLSLVVSSTALFFLVVAAPPVDDLYDSSDAALVEIIEPPADILNALPPLPEHVINEILEKHPHFRKAAQKEDNRIPALLPAQVDDKLPVEVAVAANIPPVPLGTSGSGGGGERADTGRIAPKYMLELYDKFSTDKYSHPMANIVRSFTNINEGNTRGVTCNK